MIDVPALLGSRVRLEPLDLRHVPGLVAAASGDRATYGWTTVPPDAAGMAALVGQVVTDPAERGFAQVQVADGRELGMTRLLHPHHRTGEDIPYAVEVGGTWLAAAAQRTGVNREAKLLLLTHLFDVWHVGRVDIRTDARNLRSRTAIEGLGASLDGVLRSWEPSKVVGEEVSLRDTAVYSIVPDQWPAVRRRLTH